MAYQLPFEGGLAAPLSNTQLTARAQRLHARRRQSPSSRLLTNRRCCT